MIRLLLFTLALLPTLAAAQSPEVRLVVVPASAGTFTPDGLVLDGLSSSPLAASAEEGLTTLPFGTTPSSLQGLREVHPMDLVDPSGPIPTIPFLTDGGFVESFRLQGVAGGPLGACTTDEFIDISGWVFLDAQGDEFEGVLLVIDNESWGTGTNRDLFLTGEAPSGQGAVFEFMTGTIQIKGEIGLAQLLELQCVFPLTEVA